MLRDGNRLPRSGNRCDSQCLDSIQGGLSIASPPVPGVRFRATGQIWPVVPLTPHLAHPWPPGSHAPSLDRWHPLSPKSAQQNQEPVRRLVVSALMRRALISQKPWEELEPLVLAAQPSSKESNPRLNDRAVFRGNLSVPMTGIPWEELPQELRFGRGMTCRRRLRQWGPARTARCGVHNSQRPACHRWAVEGAHTWLAGFGKQSAFASSGNWTSICSCSSSSALPSACGAWNASVSRSSEDARHLRPCCWRCRADGGLAFFQSIRLPRMNAAALTCCASAIASAEDEKQLSPSLPAAKRCSPSA